MMGPTHSASAFAAGLTTTIALAAANIYDFTPATALIFAGITAGAGLLPDLDHPQATLARTWGPVSKIMAQITNSISAGFANFTAGPKDKHVSNGHRKLTHTALFSLFIAPAIVLAIISFGGFWAQMAVVYFFVTLALQGLFRDYIKSLGPILANVLAVAITYGLAQATPETLHPTLLAFAVAVGCVAHIAGDAPTHSGVPFFAPFIRVGGKRWNDVHLLPKGMTVSASGWANTALFVISIVLSVVLFGYIVGGEFGLII